jgi:hypothetical protein
MLVGAIHSPSWPKPVARVRAVTEMIGHASPTRGSHQTLRPGGKMKSAVDPELTNDARTVLSALRLGG